VSEAARVERAASFLRGRGAGGARLAVVLGSGLARFAEQVDEAVEVPFADVPEWPRPTVEGHGGAVVLGRVEGLPVACLSGRVHLYEGWEPAEVVRAVRSLRACGVGAFLLTNAAGGLADGFAAGDLMAIEDHLNLTGSTPLAGAHEPVLGPRFPDQSRVWDDGLRARLRAADAGLRAGVYAGLLGPGYETPAEVRMLRGLGASAVGMSTVHEAIALNAMGARIAGVSLISNLAAGLGTGPLDHREVIAAGAAAEGRLTALVRALCGSLSRDPLEG
jgi:purine-nucleoside phosphorylase